MGRTILDRLGINAPLQHPPQTTALLPKSVRSQILVQPLPRNMHPIHNEGRRAARAKTITKQYGNHPLVAYTDAALYPGRRAATSIVVVGKKHQTSVFIPNDNRIVAEEVAIALTIAQATPDTIITDCQQACRNYCNGRIHQTSWQIIHRAPPRRRIKIVWAPGHQGVPGNEIAHLTARGFTNRAPGSAETHSTEWRR
ncbi:hypothetical protein HPB52_000945 [Rhipicephalus sanguineus]|uniref:RNase H type-1 domain-containing protein n=1 Tax=Rhipicephalus sanguineus TaxID=34632 RepID=A0A9D4PK87_RHISA|nr:hypothetical protein HPB52_000945 [Rhipicephalus sanguineus]